MTNSKPWYTSLTFLAGAFFVLQGFGLAGVNIDFQTGDFSGNIFELGTSVSSMLGGLAVLYGRARASTQLRFKGRR